MSIVQTAGAHSAASQDRLIYYASVFVYNPKLKQDFINYNPTIQSYEGKSNSIYINLTCVGG